MDLLTELFKDRIIGPFLKKFPENAQIDMVKKVLIFGIHSFDVISAVGLTGCIDTFNENKQKSIERTNSSKYEYKGSKQTSVIIDDTAAEPKNPKKTVQKNAKSASTPKGQKTPQSQTTTGAGKKQTFELSDSQRISSRITKKKRENSEPKVPASFIKSQPSSKRTPSAREKMVSKISNISLILDDITDFPYKPFINTPANCYSASNAKRNDSSSQLSKDYRQPVQNENPHKLKQIVLPSPKISKSALVYTTDSSEENA
ncbi:unnamed protein product [Blepharisma stoltei]|uniref:Uncharacterized protein n=1 Tax=Blepharisma stoltei TaxID=1481888 RepID=A0AAU9J4Q7_9CILI|nr:unnamed protein product [Blepharisma stoltei]